MYNKFNLKKGEAFMKKKSWIIVGAVVLVVAIIVGMFVGNYNSFVNKETNIEESRANIQTLLQKRADKIPNLVNTVKGYADYESETFKAVTEARTAASRAGTIGELESADAELTRAFNVWVNAVSEAYPDLKANTAFTGLMDEISSMENEIQYARKTYNEKAADYNKSIRRFPGSIFASMYGFEKVDMFSASNDAQNVPNISFE